MFIIRYVCSNPSPMTLPSLFTVTMPVGALTGACFAHLRNILLTTRPCSQKMMLLVEEKEIPVKISLVNMRSYGDKPNDFLRKVPGGLLPAMEVNGQVITESQVIMELLDEWHQDGYKKMMPETQQDRQRYNQLARLEREYVVSIMVSVCPDVSLQAFQLLVWPCVSTRDAWEWWKPLRWATWWRFGYFWINAGLS